MLGPGSGSIIAAGQDCDGPLDLTGDLPQTPEIICDDEIDNDADGLTDCDDPDCDCNCSFLDGTTWAVTQMDPEVSMYVLQVEIMGDQAIIRQTEDGCGEPPGMVTLDETCTFVDALTETGPHNATCNFVNDEETTGMFTETSFSASFSVLGG